MKIFWKRTVSAGFLANCLKICGNCTFSQNFDTKKLSEIAVFHAMFDKLLKELQSGFKCWVDRNCNNINFIIYLTSRVYMVQKFYHFHKIPDCKTFDVTGFITTYSMCIFSAITQKEYVLQ